MYLSRTKLVVIVTLLGLSIANAGCAISNRFQEVDLAPVRGLQIVIDKNQRKELFDQLQKFAEKHDFESKTIDFNPDGDGFQFWMSRQDFIITANDVPTDTTIVAISVYAKYSGGQVDEKVLDELLDDFKSFIGEIPNVKISEER